MYWYVSFNLFQDLILWLWPQNQYLHLWSSTYNQFCSRPLSTMDCLWLDTCKQSFTVLSFFFLQAASVALQWEVTGHSNPRLAADHHPIQLSPALCCTVLLSLHPPPVFTSLLALVTGSYMALIHDKQSAQPTAEREKQMQNKCKWPLVLSWASSLSMLCSPSHFFWHRNHQKCMVSFLWNIDAMYMQILCGIPLTTLQNCISTNINKAVKNIAWARQGRFSRLARSPPFRKA